MLITEWSARAARDVTRARSRGTNPESWASPVPVVGARCDGPALVAGTVRIRVTKTPLTSLYGM
ncbi:hypothetical protein GCM10010121_034730 [Streptomyces brasiliensis]|uniref:Uncharacterized protein n=1 Tax=Streptomyces brasiliensis TaxID=1954 RepID=A0A917KNR8_9ACTN|nr:hypothetical protein GCM10010121_034730 [Streptomyces brasiliensis]